MIPLSDVDRRPISFPVVTALIISVNSVMFLFELSGAEQFVIRWSVIPSHIAAGQDLFNILSAMFMHAGWMHIIGNMIYLWAFGPEIEDVMGRIRYSFFYLLGGLFATVAQVLINISSDIPNLGASGAIAAVMGAFLITFPRDRIRTLVFIGWYVTISFIPAIILVGFWVALQLLSEVGSVVGKHSDGVACMAHIGGVVFGMVTARFFEIRKRISQL